MAFKLDNISTIQTAKKEVVKTSFLNKEITLFSNNFSNKIKEDFYTELSVLLKSGIALKDSLDLIGNAVKKRQVQQIIKSISNTIVLGESFSESIRNHKEFTSYELFSIKIGEETGTLFQVTEQLGTFFNRKNEQRRQLINALTYPAIILVTAILAVVFMLQFVVPMFQDVFKQQQVELPEITKFIIRVSAFVTNYGLYFILIIILLIFAKRVFNKKLWYRKIKDNLLLKLPFVGKFIKTVYLSQFTQAVSLLTASKVPVVNSIQLAKQMLNFYPLQQALETVEQDIIRGESLSKSLNKHSLFDPKMIALVKVAEETNQNEFIFNRLNTQYNTQVMQQSKMISTLIEPAVIFIVGILVGVILVGMYLPMFELNSILG